MNSPGHINNKEECEHENVQLKLLCGGDLLESFAVPGLWKDEDVCMIMMIDNLDIKKVTSFGRATFSNSAIYVIL